MKKRILLTLLFFSLSTFAFTNIMAQDVNSSTMLPPPTTEKKRRYGHQRRSNGRQLFLAARKIEPGSDRPPEAEMPTGQR